MKMIKFVFLSSLVFALASSVQSQVRAVNDHGATGLAQMINRLNTTASVMMIGAHPDDEDSALMAYLARGENARTAYLSLTRGDGGQNIIGPELFEALGVIRTEELLQARRLDGAEQYFTRAFDYGFSKTLAEARAKWDEKVIVCDAVRAIRHFRPMVVISRFSGTPADGHGHHQYAGFISPLAVAASGDRGQCTQAGEPWRVKKFYIEQGFGDTSIAPLRINTGRYDPILGRSYYELAIEGRSQHRSQGEGRIEMKGDQFSGLWLQGAAENKEISPFDGLDTTIRGIAALTGNNEGTFAEKLVELQTAVESLRAKFRPAETRLLVPDLKRAYKSAHDAEWSTRQPSSKLEVSRIKEGVAGALAVAAGIQVDALVDRETAAPGETVNVSIKSYYPEENEISLRSVQLASNCEAAVADWCREISIEPWTAPPAAPSPRREIPRNSSYFRVKLGKVPVTEPYWLVRQRESDVYRWDDAARSDMGMPFAAEYLTANVSIAFEDTNLTFRSPVRYRMADPARGELRRELNVVPPVTVKLDQELLIISASAKAQTRRVFISVVNNSDSTQAGKISLAGPVWAGTKTADIELAAGARTRIGFDITVPALTAVGTYEMPVSISLAAGPFEAVTMHTIAYPHIQTHRYYTPAAAKLAVIDLKTVRRRIGYIMGSGDDVADAIKQMGSDVVLLGETDLVAGDLTKFDSIVVGIRAVETRADLLASRNRILDYVRQGGNLVIQYQRGGFAQAGLAPYPVDTADKQRTAAGSIARVVDEKAEVTILEPAHPIFNVPNKITSADFEGWVQERNAYNLVTFDSQYTPLLESHDAGEIENKGGLVVARVGRGTWMYCSYSLFRQLPAGVPGAYRLFANIISRRRAG